MEAEKERERTQGRRGDSPEERKEKVVCERQ